MKQMKVEPESIVEPDFETTAAYKVLKPELFKDGDSVCCLYGPDPQIGIFGCGSTGAEAAEDWENNLKDRINANKSGDKVAQEAVDKMRSEVQERRKRNVQAFYDQFRPAGKR